MRNRKTIDNRGFARKGIKIKKQVLNLFFYFEQIFIEKVKKMLKFLLGMFIGVNCGLVLFTLIKAGSEGKYE